MTQFKQKPKHGDTEVRIVESMNTTDPDLISEVAKIKARPKETLTEQRIFINGKWLDWKQLS